MLLETSPKKDIMQATVDRHAAGTHQFAILTQMIYYIYIIIYGFR